MKIHLFLIAGILFPFIASCIGWSKQKLLGKDLKIILVYCIIGFATELIQFTLIRVFKFQNTLFIGHLYNPFQFTMVSLFYAFYIKSVIKQKYITLIIILFILISIANSAFFQSIYVFNNYMRSLSRFILIGYNILYFYVILRDLKFTQPSKEPSIWVSSGFLIYFSGSFLYYIFTNYLLAISMELLLKFGYMHMILGFFCYVMIIVAFILVKRKVNHKVL